MRVTMPGSDPASGSKRSKTWAMDMLRKYMPTREEMATNKYLAPIAHRFLSPELWRFTRRSVPRGVALGLFAAFIIPVGQIFLAAFLALPSRANVPLAALVTFVTNPFTLPFWLVVANKVGNVTLRIDADGPALANSAVETGAWSKFAEFFELAGTTAFGFAVMAAIAPAVGYLVSGWIWRAVVARRRAKRLKVMEARLDQRLGEH
ncbi:putative membrane protein [Erythrobacter dokdonensis DSW-74]|uniref:Putative membrane protein n=2 Tax=Erythrobacter TaxID=1041 RepID=A0A1A7BIP8_9SPHN|nr:putative membrane protein [Erythrobacter dokdonensis DSW-74]